MLQRTAPPWVDPLAVAPGWRRDNRFTLKERLGDTAFSPSLYNVPQLTETRELFRLSAKLSANHTSTKGAVVPFLALRCGYRTSVAGCALGTLCGAGFDLRWNYDWVHSWRIGAELNLKWFGDRPDIFAPWHTAEAVVFYPSVFDERGVPTPGDQAHLGTTSFMQHFVIQVSVPFTSLN